jgi:hypothetical protein
VPLAALPVLRELLSSPTTWNTLPEITLRSCIASPKDSNFHPLALKALLLLTTAQRRGRVEDMEGALARAALHLSGAVRMERVCMACRRSWASDEVLRRIISRRMKVVGMVVMWVMGES